MKPENNTNADFCVCCGEPVPEREDGLSFLRDEPQTDCSIYADQTDKEIKETIWHVKGTQK